MDGIVPINERHKVLPVVPFAIPPVWADRCNPVNFGVHTTNKGSGSGSKGSISFPC